MITFDIQAERPAVDPLVTSGHWVKVHTPQPVGTVGGGCCQSLCETDYSEALKNLPVSALVTSRLQQSLLCMENVRQTFISKVLHYC